MSCPPLHINRLSLDSNGWIIQEVASTDDVAVIEKPILPRCQRLLDALQLSLSSDVFSTPNGTTVNEHGADGGVGVGGNEGDVVMVEPLGNLVHQVGLVDKIISAIEEIRRLGNKRGKGNRHRVGKVASLENQRRLRQQNEQKKLVQQASTMTTSTTTTLEDGEEAPDEDEEILDDDDDEFEVPELKLAAVFNSLRVVIDITRPMLDHPQCQDLGLQMKNGPSIQKSGDKNRYYLLSKKVYFCVGYNGWRRLKFSYKNLLEDLQEGLPARMSKQVGGGRYEIAAKDWVANLFNHEQYLNKEHLATRCMAFPTLNSAVVSKLNAALIDRFDHDRDGMQSLLHRSINKLHQHLSNAISRRFNGARLTVYGSCLSGLALEGSHDVDISIYLPQLDRLKQDFDGGTISAAEYEKKMRKTIFNVRDILQNYRSEQFLDLFAVTRARVPVIKGSMIAQNPHTPDGSLAFDLCFLNEIAVVNSSLLKEYSLFDKNVRLLMLSVKSFAKKNGIASAAEGTLSSYSWLNLVVFYLQCIGMVPVLNCPKMMESHGLQYDPSNPWHSINGLQTLYLTKDEVMQKNMWQRAPHEIHTNPAMLLYGFFNFYSSIFPHQTVAASIRFGEMSLQKTCLHQSSKLWRICVEDPFETCDSHCPHDLGCHVLENGQKNITACLKQAKSMLGKMLQNDMASEGDLSKLLSNLLWTTTNSKNVNAKDSVGNQNKPAGAVNKHQNAPRNRASRQNVARERQPQSAAHQPHASHAKIVPNAQNGTIVPRAQNGTVVPNAQKGMIHPNSLNGVVVSNAQNEKIAPNAQNGTGGPTAQNTRILPHAQIGKIAPNAQIRKQGVKNNVPNVRVGNLSYDTTWKELKNLFCRIGEVERSDIATNSRGRSLGVGFIRYYSAEDAKRAIVELDGVEFMGRPLEVKMGKAPFKK